MLLRNVFSEFVPPFASGELARNPCCFSGIEISPAENTARVYLRRLPDVIRVKSSEGFNVVGG